MSSSPISIGVCGSKGSGKTLLVKRLTTSGDFNFSAVVEKTSSTIIQKLEGEGFQFHDAGGSDTLKNIRKVIYKKKKIFLLCVSIEENETNVQSQIDFFLKEIKDFSDEKNSIVLVATKLDLGDKNFAKIEEYAKKQGIYSFFKVSSKTGEKIVDLKKHLGKLNLMTPTTSIQEEDDSPDDSPITPAQPKREFGEDKKSNESESSDEEDDEKEEKKKKKLKEEPVQSTLVNNSLAPKYQSATLGRAINFVINSQKENKPLTPEFSRTKENKKEKGEKKEKERKYGGQYLTLKLKDFFKIKAKKEEEEKEKLGKDSITPSGIGKNFENVDSPFEIHFHADMGNAMDVAKFVNSGIDLNVVDTKYNTPLHLAVMKKREEVVKVLLSFPDLLPNQVNSEGMTPLALATVSGYDEIVEMLLLNGRCSPHFKTRHGLPLQMISNQTGDDFICTKQVYKRQEDNERKFLEAVAKRDRSAVKEMIKIVDPSCVNTQGYNAVDLLTRGPFESQEIPDKSSDKILHSVIKEGCKIRSSIFKDERDQQMILKQRYRKFLMKKIRKQKRKKIFTKLLINERKFLNLVDVIVDILVVPLEKKFVSGSESSSVSIETKHFLSSFCEGFVKLRMMSQFFIKTLIPLVLLKGKLLEQILINSFQVIDMTLFHEVISNCVTLQNNLDALTKEKDYGAIRQFLNNQLANVPIAFNQFPFVKAKSISLALSVPKQRLIDHYECLKKIYRYTNPSEVFYNDLSQTLSIFEQNKNEIVSSVFISQNKISLEKISSIFVEKYKSDHDLLKNTKRKCVCHELKLPSLNLLGDKNGIGVTGISDVFLFSDSLFIGNQKTLSFHFFFDCKTIFELNDDTFRIQMFKEKKPVLDMLFYVMPAKFAPHIEEFFFFNDFYSSRMLYFNHTYTQRIKESFLSNESFQPKDMKEARKKILLMNLEHSENEEKIIRRSLKILEGKTSKSESKEEKKEKKKKKKEKEEKEEKESPKEAPSKDEKKEKSEEQKNDEKKL